MRDTRKFIPIRPTMDRMRPSKPNDNPGGKEEKGMTSANLYLNIEKVKKHPDFSVSNGMKNGKPVEEMRLRDKVVFESAEGWFITGSVETIPDYLEEMMTSVTVHAYFTINPPRERGIYRHNSAEGELEHANNFKLSGLFCLKIKAIELFDARELLRQVKAGVIRPELSFDSPQSGKTRDELEAELSLAKAEMSRLSDKLARLAKLADRIKSSWWPFSSNSKIVAAIDCILISTTGESR